MTHNDNPNAERAETQIGQILDALRRGDALTPLEAWRRFGCSRLAARVHQLRRCGVVIDARAIRVQTADGRSARVAEYRLVSEG